MFSSLVIWKVKTDTKAKVRVGGKFQFWVIFLKVVKTRGCRLDLMGTWTFWKRLRPLVRALYSESKGSGFKTTGRLQDRLSIFSVRGRWNEDWELLGTYWLKVNCFLVVALQPWHSWTLPMKMGHKNLSFSCLLSGATFYKFLRSYRVPRKKIKRFSKKSHWFIFTCCHVKMKKP